MSREQLELDLAATKDAMTAYSGKIQQVEDAIAGIDTDDKNSTSAGIATLQQLKDDITNLIVPGLPDQVRTDLAQLVQGITDNFSADMAATFN